MEEGHPLTRESISQGKVSTSPQENILITKTRLSPISNQARGTSLILTQLLNNLGNTDKVNF